MNISPLSRGQYEPSGACSVARRYAADIIDVLQEEGFSIKEP